MSNVSPKRNVDLTLTHDSSAILVPVYVATMLLSACLLFLVQPMFARMALPLLGGTPAVWAIAMCFFQAVLLGGYCYAHLLKKYLKPQQAVVVHVLLMAGAWFYLPVNLPSSAVSTGGNTAGLWLIGLMAKSIGYPFFFLSATAPLLQSWFARTTHSNAANPYFLYSASNIGSIGALFLYPFIVEPLIGLRLQAQLWSAGFMLLVVCIAICGVIKMQSLAPATLASLAKEQSQVTNRVRCWWVFMSFVPSALLVAWTNHITTDIASAPFLWLPPLVMFLLTFVLVFRDEPLISIRAARVAQLASLPVAFGVQFALPVALAVPVMMIGAVSFFATSIICHRQLYESRPTASQLTEFYMLMSVGGVLGGLFVSLVAPLIFNTVAEYPLLLILGVAVSKDLLEDEKLRAVLRSPTVPLLIFAGVAVLIAFSGFDIGLHKLLSSTTLQIAFFGTCAFVMLRAGRSGLSAIALILIVFLFMSMKLNPHERLAMRSYFGVLTVSDKGIQGPFRLLTHGTTVHGAQRLSELTSEFKGKPQALTYYNPDGGMAQALMSTQERLAAQGKKGVYRIVGLGTGSLACYSNPGEDWAFYEIDRDVIDVAKDPSQFTFLSNCGPDMPMIEGDARITLQNEAASKADYLLIDAFSSDSIPVHLMTTEALQLYLARLNEDGILVMHLSNRYMDLVPVVAANMKAVDPTLHGRVFKYTFEGESDLNALKSLTVVMSRNANTLEGLDKNVGVSPLQPTAGVEQWTDDFSNLPSAIWRQLMSSKT